MNRKGKRPARQPRGQVAEIQKPAGLQTMGAKLYEQLQVVIRNLEAASYAGGSASS